jgi:hypothetical protein
LVTPKKNEEYGQPTVSGDIKTSRAVPPFRTEWPVMWFAQAEAQFTLAGISNKRTGF